MNLSRSNSSGAFCMSVKCIFSLSEITAIITVFSLLFVASLLGNILLLCLLKKDHQLRSKTSASHVSLAVADLLVTLFCFPFMLTDLYIAEKWIFGAAFCKVVTFIQTASSTSSILNLLIVTLECFFAICFPFYLRLLKRKRLILMVFCTVAWVIATIQGIVYVQFKEYSVHQGVPYCMENWPSIDVQNNFIYANVILISILPIFIITILNACSVARLCHAKTLGLHSNRRCTKTSNTRTATKKIILISVIFIVCRTPHQVFGLPFVHTVGLKLKTYMAMYSLVYVLYFLSAATHPVVFSFMSLYYKDAFRRQWMRFARKPLQNNASFRTVQSTRINDTCI